MCGIAGFCNFEGDKQSNIERMKRRIYHRGPDAGGSFFSEDGQVVLGTEGFRSLTCPRAVLSPWLLTAGVMSLLTTEKFTIISR